MSIPSKAKLTDDEGAQVVFDFNPTTVTIETGNSSNSYGTSDVVDMAYEVTGRHPTKLKLAEVVFEGAATKEKVAQLEQWMKPERVEGPAATGYTEFKVWLLTPLTFTWGSQGLNESVELESLTATFTRFTSDGMPVRAKVSITLHVMAPKLTGTNPTSGGLPGRRAVTLVQGQNLQALALDSYGSPVHWRRVAQLNSIDDPLRVRPGAVVYLPNRDELLEEGTG
jgi:hypothetical protein